MKNYSHYLEIFGSYIFSKDLCEQTLDIFGTAMENDRF